MKRKLLIFLAFLILMISGVCVDRALCKPVSLDQECLEYVEYYLNGMNGDPLGIYSEKCDSLWDNLSYSQRSDVEDYLMVR